MDERTAAGETEHHGGRSRITEIFAPRYLGATLMLGGGVALHAIEVYISITVLPSVVRDVGGLDLFAWATTLFVACSLLGSVFITARPRGLSLRQAYVIGAIFFGAGSLFAALSPSMPLLIAGRGVQGFGAGIIVALGYAFVRHAYPERLWNMAGTLYAAVWGAATFIGPSLGGLFSSGSLWRFAFAIPLPFTVLMALFATRLLPKAEDDRGEIRVAFPQILLMVAAVVLLSLAGSAEDATRRILWFGLALVSSVGVVLAERLLPVRLFPEGATRLSTPLGLIYAFMMLVLLVLSADVYIPYFLQELHGVPPLFSGYLVALVALGWTGGAFLTTHYTGNRAIASIILGAALEMAGTASLTLTMARENPTSDLALLGVVSVGIFFMGAGVGLGWSHLVALVLRLARDDEKDRASAAITMMQSLGSGFGAALAGVIVNSTGLLDPGGTEGNVSAAHWLFLLFALPAAAALLAGLALKRRLAA
ncbi:MFS transporter [Gellertiella hungarica]|uniref:MFS family permease n=1 Tax=Gellertiella hungarica TaxID=1572859 RepID=A0A7W6NKP4_9HYPH|nr:MFS transporter [Gellertiella hungarica]MBB4064507.1 MFS family permease [Gellertiella hungarica]